MVFSKLEVNQLDKFVSNLAQLTAPICYLLKADINWQWSHVQAEAFERVKQALTSPTALARYEPQRSTIIAADAFCHGLGAVLMQVQDIDDRRPVCFASRALPAVEQRHAVIEKETLAATWACVLGMTPTLETDHKPLVPVLSSTDLVKIPPRIRYNPEVQYVQGRLHVSADALSHAPVGSPSTADMQLIQEVDTLQTC